MLSPLGSPSPTNYILAVFLMAVLPTVSWRSWAQETSSNWWDCIALQKQHYQYRLKNFQMRNTSTVSSASEYTFLRQLLSEVPKARKQESLPQFCSDITRFFCNRGIYIDRNWWKVRQPFWKFPFFHDCSDISCMCQFAQAGNLKHSRRHLLYVPVQFCTANFMIQ